MPGSTVPRYVSVVLWSHLQRACSISPAACLLLLTFHLFPAAYLGMQARRALGMCGTPPPAQPLPPRRRCAAAAAFLPLPLLLMVLAAALAAAQHPVRFAAFIAAAAAAAVPRALVSGWYLSFHPCPSGCRPLLHSSAALLRQLAAGHLSDPQRQPDQHRPAAPAAQLLHLLLQPPPAHQLRL